MSTPLRDTVEIRNKRGLHARAASKFVKLVGQYDAMITVSKDGSTVGGESIMGLMMLAAAQGTTIEIQTTGPDADAAHAALLDLVNRKFDEE